MMRMHRMMLDFSYCVYTLSRWLPRLSCTWVRICHTTTVIFSAWTGTARSTLRRNHPMLPSSTSAVSKNLQMVATATTATSAAMTAVATIPWRIELEHGVQVRPSDGE